MKRRGEALRPDDNPDILKQRLEAYSAQTAPLVDYFRGKRALRTVDGMASIGDVSAAIAQALAKPRSSRTAAKRKIVASKPKAKKAVTTVKGAKVAKRARSGAKKASQRAARKAVRPSSPRSAPKASKRRKSGQSRRLTK
jgi:adenylate kinase